MSDSDIEERKRKLEQDPELQHKLATWLRTFLNEVYDYNNMEVVRTKKTMMFEQDPELDHKLATWLRTILHEILDHNNLKVIRKEKTRR